MNLSAGGNCRWDLIRDLIEQIIGIGVTDRVDSFLVTA